MSRVAAAVRAGTREYRRTPVLVALLVVLPAYTVGVFALVAPDATVGVQTSGGVVSVPVSRATAAVTAPMAAALVAGVAGLFLLRGAGATDRRLVVAGCRPWQVVAARVALLVAVAATATVVAVGVARWAFAPESMAGFAAATFFAALAYGLVGLLAGLALGRLGGVYAVLFGTLVDLFVFQNPLATEAPAAARFLPGHYPVAMATDAAFGAGVAAGDLLGSLTVVGVLAAAGVVTGFAKLGGRRGHSAHSGCRPDGLDGRVPWVSRVAGARPPADRPRPSPEPLTGTQATLPR